MQDHFAFYDIPEAYHLDVAALKQRFMARSRELHPDFHTLADAETQARNLALSSQNNQAWRILSAPHLRLQYLLQRYDLLDAEGANLSGVDLSPDFLMEVMELNEALLDNPDSVRAQVQVLSQAVEAALSQALHTFDAAKDMAARREALRSCMQPYLRLKYLKRLASQ